jgi:hypothetical protein
VVARRVSEGWAPSWVLARSLGGDLVKLTHSIDELRGLWKSSATVMRAARSRLISGMIELQFRLSSL